MLDIPGQLNGQRAARPAHAEIAIKLRALIQNDGHRGERDHVVDHRGLAKQSLNGRQRRLEPDLAALAFQALEQRSFFAANISARAEPDVQIETLAATRTLAPR